MNECANTISEYIEEAPGEKLISKNATHQTQYFESSVEYVSMEKMFEWIKIWKSRGHNYHFNLRGN